MFIRRTELIPLYQELRGELGYGATLDLLEELVRLGCISALEDLAWNDDVNPQKAIGLAL